MNVEDYRKSHTAPDKGISYDESFHRRSYRGFIWSWEQKILRSVIEEYYVPGQKINYLDFACGTCRIASLLENSVNESYGVDVSESMLEVARQKVKNTTLINADLTCDNVLLGKKFDLITVFRFFLNAQQQLRMEAAKILSELLAPDGYLVLNIHLNKGSIFERMINLYRSVKGYPKNSYNSIRVSEMDTILQNSGLQIVAIYHYGIIPVFREDAEVPLWLFDRVEASASQKSSYLPLSRYLIYVCKHKVISNG